MSLTSHIPAVLAWLYTGLIALTAWHHRTRLGSYLALLNTVPCLINTIGLLIQPRLLAIGLFLSLFIRLGNSRAVSGSINWKHWMSHAVLCFVLIALLWMSRR